MRCGNNRFAQRSSAPDCVRGAVGRAQLIKQRQRCLFVPAAFPSTAVESTASRPRTIRHLTVAEKCIVPLSDRVKAQPVTRSSQPAISFACALHSSGSAGSLLSQQNQLTIFILPLGQREKDTRNALPLPLRRTGVRYKEGVCH